MISIVLYRPQKSGNIGAIARVMKNFGFKDLIMINPECKIDEEARKRAVHAQDILKKAKIREKSYLKSFDYLIATTAMIGTDYNIPRSPITPAQLAEKLPKTSKKIGLLFGPEDHGLSNDEINQCDFVVKIPTTKRYPTLNLSHAVSIMLYELSKVKAQPIHALAGRTEKHHLMKRLSVIVKNLDFETEQHKKTQLLVWKRMIGKSFLTKREAFALHGFFRKLGALPQKWLPASGRTPSLNNSKQTRGKPHPGICLSSSDTVSVRSRQPGAKRNFKTKLKLK